VADLFCFGAALLSRGLQFSAIGQYYHQFNFGLNAKRFINGVEVRFDRAFAYTKCVSDQSVRKASAN
jgi:hypothetical protein